MKKIMSILSVVVIALGVFSIAPSQKADADEQIKTYPNTFLPTDKYEYIKCKVNKITSDNKVACAGHVYELFGLNFTPIKKQDTKMQIAFANKYLKKTIANKTVDIYYVKNAITNYLGTTYKYKGFVYKSNVNVNETLISLGNAGYKKETENDEYNSTLAFAQKVAKTAKKGIWGLSYKAITASEGKRIVKIAKGYVDRDDMVCTTLVHMALIKAGYNFPSSIGLHWSGLWADKGQIVNMFAIDNPNNIKYLVKQKVAQKVSLKKLRAGDILVWQGHIAIYIGNGKAVHGGMLSKDGRYHHVTISGYNIKAGAKRGSLKAAYRIKSFR